MRSMREHRFLWQPTIPPRSAQRAPGEDSTGAGVCSEPNGDPGATPASPGQAPRDYQALGTDAGNKEYFPSAMRGWLCCLTRFQPAAKPRCDPLSTSSKEEGHQCCGRSVNMNGLPLGLIRGLDAGNPAQSPNSHI